MFSCSVVLMKCVCDNHYMCEMTSYIRMAEALERVLLEDLQCPVCDHYMCPPIRQCQKGHSICDHCFPKLKICPKCRSPKSQARSFALEAIHSKLNIPCRYAITGCGFISLGEHIRSHEAYCRLAPKHCPFKNYDNCQWKDVTSKLKSHLVKKHASNFYIKEKQRFLSQNFRNIANYHYIYVVIHAYKEFFRLTWDIDEVTGMTRWAIYYMGSPENAKRYSYKIEFPREPNFDDISTSIIWKAPCEAMPEDDDVKFAEHNCLYVHKNLLKTYCEFNGDLNYRVTIYSSSSGKNIYINDVSNLFVDLSVTD